MTVKWVTNGKLRVQVGTRNAREWLEWLEKSNANGVAKITSINHRAAQHTRWKEQGAKAPEPEEDGSRLGPLHRLRTGDRLGSCGNPVIPSVLFARRIRLEWTPMPGTTLTFP